MSEKEFDVYFSLKKKKLESGIFNKLDESSTFFYSDDIEIDSIDENTNFQNVELSIEKNIKKIEKNIGKFVNNIFLMIDTDQTISICISLMKKIDNRKIQKKDIQYLIQDAKQQILLAYSNMSIFHIIINKYVIDGLDYNFAPKDISCNKISLDIEFICLPRNLIKKLEGLFSNFQISVDRIICSKYAKSTLGNRIDDHICKIGHNINNGYNKQEVVIVPKKVEKKGFFEKLFYFFK